MKIMTVRSKYLLLLVCGACAQPEAPKPTWNRDVGPLLQSKCGDCHVSGGIGPFALTTFAEVMGVKDSVRSAIVTRRMPPWPAARGCAEYVPDGSLSDEQIALVEKWLDEGAMEGNPADFKALGEPPNALSRVDLSVPMQKPFTPTRAPDEYRCFVLDWPKAETTFITGYALAPGNEAMIHHADIFFIRPQHADKYRAKDPSGDGYTCYDIPVLEGGWIGTFVPGNLGVDFPEESGLRIEPGSKIFIQTHYNTTYTGKQPDLSALNLRLETRVKKRALVEALSDLKWIRDDDMLIPAYAKDTMHDYVEDPTLFISAFDPTFVDGVPVKVHAGTLHMHQMGSSAKFEIIRKDGTKQCIVDIPKWDFHWQLPYTLRTPIVVNPGDQLRVECRWDNSQENQPYVDGVQRTPVDLNWGARTEDEMCVAGVYLTQ